MTSVVQHGWRDEKPAEGKKPRHFALNILGANDDWPRMVRAYGRACGGEFALVMRPREGRAILVHIAKEGARVWTANGGSDCPLAPATETTPAEAVAAAKAEQRDPPKEGPATMRGSWRGRLYCDDHQPRVVLERRLATYGTLRLESHPGEGWSWAFARGERWFSTPEESRGSGLPTLSAAIEAGLLGALQLVKEACSFRDTRRRAAVDAAYAAEHPVRPEREKKDPVDRLKERAPRDKNKKDAHAPEAPTPAPTAAVEAGIASAFGLTGMPGVTVVPPPVDADPLPESPDCPKELKRIADITRKDAQALAGLTEWEKGWKSTAEAGLHLQRARALIRHGQALVRSPLCQGRERDEATAALRRATEAYEAARKALAAGRTWDAAREVRHVGEKVALAAARAAKACAAGQTSLGLTGTCRHDPVPPPAPAPTPKAPSRAGKPGKGRDTEPPRRPRAPVPSPAPAAVASAEPDPEKDKALLDAFAAAIQAALAGKAAA
ncbi:hypothetical protein L6R50_09145 [Myxococcota bacterium]|nr:hypothetical protein [Myxococcota bacterium]